MIDKWFDEPFDVFSDNGDCYPNVTHVVVGKDDNESYIEDTNGEILYFSEMDYTMVRNVLCNAE